MNATPKPLPPGRIFLLVTKGALCGLAMGALFGLCVGKLTPSFFAHFIPWNDVEPVGFAIMLMDPWLCCCDKRRVRSRADFFLGLCLLGGDLDEEFLKGGMFEAHLAQGPAIADDGTGDFLADVM